MTVFIGVGGGSGAGKTTAADAIADVIKRSDDQKIAEFPLDSVYRDRSHLPMEERKNVNYDYPYAWEWKKLDECVDNLIKHGRAKIPQYDFNYHVRKEEKIWLPEPKEGERIPERADVVILEGIYALFDPDLEENPYCDEEISILDKLDEKVYVEGEVWKRFVRRLNRDITERGRSVSSVYDQFFGSKEKKDGVLDMHLDHVQPTRDNADYVIDGGLEKRKMIKKAERLGEKFYNKLKAGIYNSDKLKNEKHQVNEEKISQIE